MVFNGTVRYRADVPQVELNPDATVVFNKAELEPGDESRAFPLESPVCLLIFSDMTVPLLAIIMELPPQQA
jgi:hypothetical protein